MPFILVLLLLILPAPAAAQLPAAEAEWEELPIERGDLLRLSVWREEEYSGEFPVDARGRVGLPLVGEWEVVGVPPEELRSRLSDAFAERLRDPILTLTVLRRVRILGEVTQPGLYHLDETMSVADALAMAGGRTPTAEEGLIRLRRNEVDILEDVRTGALLSTLRIRSGDELLVLRESWVRRNSQGLIGGGLGFLGVVLAVLAQ